MKIQAIAFLAALAVSVPALAGTLEGTVTATGLRSNADAVVYIASIPGKSFSPPEEHPLMDQQNMVFVPRVLPVLVGSTVDFKNSDNVSHNVFSPDNCGGEFDLGSWGRGEVRGQKFDEACAVTILCFMHADMEAFVVAVPTPYFATTDASGHFEIPDVPDGTYTVKVWHPKRKPIEKEIAVQGATSVELTLER